MALFLKAAYIPSCLHLNESNFIALYFDLEESLYFSGMLMNTFNIQRKVAPII